MPATATDAELDYFGIPARPAADSQAFKAWSAEWVDRYSGFAVAQPCSPVEGASAAVYYRNWSGIVAYTTLATEALGTTTYVKGSQCVTQPDSYTNWVGIGGAAGNDHLLQNGFWTDHAGGTYPFYEAISGSLNTYTVPITISGDPNNGLGHAFNISTTIGAYALSVGFHWHDLNTGSVSNLIFTTFTINGTDYGTQTFYSGTSAEAIDERGTINGSYTTLRNYGTDPWTNADVMVSGGSLVAMRSVSHDGITMRNNAGTVYSDVAGGSTLDAFTDTWYTCGTVGN